MAPSHPSTRLRRKEHTRQALLRAALKLLAQNSFDAISLREVTREAGITPTAFYRHFDDMEELGLVLVEESFHTLSSMLTEARAAFDQAADFIDRSLSVVVAYLNEHADHFRFIARERYGGLRRLRRAIARELQLFADELAIDLAAVPGVEEWSLSDRRMLAGLVTETIIEMAADLIECAPGEQGEIVDRAGRQLRLIALGASAWSARPLAASPATS
ncbi:MAG TPA: TetR family transcriptional regulator [Acidimicrobiales bacterium]|jgi:AcrR family transcriptional regulator